MRFNHRAAQDKKNRAAIKSDALFASLTSKTPAQVGDWIDANVTDLASAKQVLTILAKALLVLAKQITEKEN